LPSESSRCSMVSSPITSTSPPKSGPGSLRVHDLLLRFLCTCLLILPSCQRET
jgi:hypothetical protein